MQKRTLAVFIIMSALVVIGACKKSTSAAAKPGNTPHTLSDTFYYRALLDTTWIYHGDNNKAECNGTIGVCSAFLYDATFTLHDSANTYPHDSIIRSWVGKTFVTSTDSVSKAYTFSFTYPDSLYRQVSTENTGNIGSRLTIISVDSNGVSAYAHDTAGHGYRCYKIKGTFNANVAAPHDSVVHRITQGVFSLSVMESTYH